VEENISEDHINRIYQPPYEIDPAVLNSLIPFLPNEYMILKNGRKSALGTYDPVDQRIHRVDKTQVYGITPRNAEQTFALDALLNDTIQLVTISGKAGTGKTLLALASALERRKHYRQIYLARPVIPLSNKDIGFLPGDVESKLDPYMQPLYDNLGVIKNQFASSSSKNVKIRSLLEEEKLVIAPLAYIRGRSLVKIFFIVDEAQNLTPHEVKSIITRAGSGTKIVFTGDIFQIDHPYLDSHSNGLSYLIEKMHGQKLYAHINLVKGERSELSELACDLL
jgi:PhoH-like ATPase